MQMPRPTQELTDHELGIMSLLWDESPLSINDILDRYEKKPKPAYNSILTAVRAIEKKGYLTHEKYGKAYLYRPTVPKPRFMKRFVKDLLGKVFSGSAYDAAVHLIRHEKLSKQEIEALKKILEEQ
jgi:predicted transcriptional regulator